MRVFSTREREYTMPFSKYLARKPLSMRGCVGGGGGGERQVSGNAKVEEVGYVYENSVETKRIF